MRLNLGSGNDYRKGWVNVDAAPHRRADMNCDIRDLDFPPNTCTEIDALHVLEHFPRNEHEGLLQRWHYWMEPDGMLTIEVPDMAAILDQWRSWPDWQLYVFGSSEGGLEQHLSGFTQEDLSKLLRSTGFDVATCERYADVTKNRGGLPCLRARSLAKKAL